MKFEALSESPVVWATREMKHEGNVIVTTTRALVSDTGSVYPDGGGLWLKALCYDQWVDDMKGPELDPGEECCFKLVFGAL